MTRARKRALLPELLWAVRRFRRAVASSFKTRSPGSPSHADHGPQLAPIFKAETGRCMKSSPARRTNGPYATRMVDSPALPPSFRFGMSPERLLCVLLKSFVQPILEFAGPHPQHKRSASSSVRPTAVSIRIRRRSLSGDAFRRPTSRLIRIPWRSHAESNQRWPEVNHSSVHTRRAC